MKLPSIKDMVKDNQQVHFRFYRTGELWYETDCGFMFPVPLDDTGTACFNRDDRAMIFMRYIRKHHEMLVAELTREGVLNA